MQPKAALRNGQPAPAQARSGWIMPFVFRTAGPSSQLIWTAVMAYVTSVHLWPTYPQKALIGQLHPDIPTRNQESGHIDRFKSFDDCHVERFDGDLVFPGFI